MFGQLVLDTTMQFKDTRHLWRIVLYHSAVNQNGSLNCFNGVLICCEVMAYRYLSNREVGTCNMVVRVIEAGKHTSCYFQGGYCGA